MPTLWLPGRMPGLNELLDGKSQAGKWNAYNGLKKNWASVIQLVVRARGLSPQGPSYLSALWCEPNKKRDPDNILSGGFKLLNDAFVSSGVLAGDGWSEVLGLVGYWHLKPERVGVLVHFSPERLVSRETMLVLLGEEIGKLNGHSSQKAGNGTGNRSDDRPGAHAQEAAAGDAPARGQLGKRSAVG